MRPGQWRMTHEYRLRIYYEDTDAGGIVYHANYLKFAERARSEALIDLGMSQITLREREGLLFVVRAMTLDFRAPARLEEVVVVRTQVESLGGARIVMRQDICRDDDILVRCHVTLVCVGREGRATRTPNAVRDRLRLLAAEGAAGV